MSSLNETIKNFSNQYLVEQYNFHREQYMAEAIKLMEEEIKSRGISKDEIDAIIENSDNIAAEPATIVHYDKKEFSPLEAAFSTNDSLLVRAMLAEHKMPAYMDTSSSILPFDGEELDAHTVVFHVHNNSLEQAKALIAEHFDRNGNRFFLKFSDVKTRLKSFNFYEVPRSTLDSKEITEVDFSKAEKDVIITYGTRLISEVEEIEAKQNRVVFHYDSLEDLVARLENDESIELTHTDLLAALEILQIYCDDPGFPPEAIGIIEALLGFFLPQQGTSPSP
jgi:hypothetical protein